VSGELKKMVIEAHKKPDYSDAAVATFEVMFNPNSYTQKYEVEYQDRQGQGDASSPQVFGKIKPQEYTFEFVFDGTGAAAAQADVQQVVDKFLKVAAEHDGDIHRPMYLLLTWGTLVSRCVLKSAETTYTLFKPDGSPLRAKVKATFAEGKDDKRRVAEQRTNSPDLTHIHVVKAGEHLSQLCDHYYGEPGRYLQVAAYNRLTNYRCLATGSRLAFPPIRVVGRGETPS
jgi:hypothetical protein